MVTTQLPRRQHTSASNNVSSVKSDRVEVNRVEDKVGQNEIKSTQTSSISGDFSGAFAQNHNNTILPTPIKVDSLSRLLSGYDDYMKSRLIEGFTQGFPIPSSIQANPDKHGYQNHRTVQMNTEVVKKKLDTEILKGRISGPFDAPPLQNMIFSPLGLVPKKAPGEYRVIHDLSFPKKNSVNSHIDSEDTVVQYETLDTCVELIQCIGRGCLIAKADLQDAFRIIPIHPDQYRLLGFQWEGKYYYDRCLPMGCSISCQVFESLSNALQWILKNKLGVKFTSHILDDFIFFGHPQTDECQKFLNTFLALSETVNLPVKQSKTVLPSTTVILHGIEVDTLKMETRLPQDKVKAAKESIEKMYRRKKVKLKELQSLIGTLNFACRVVVSGRTFLRRLIDLTKGVQNPHHYIRLNNEARKDLSAWKVFLDKFNGCFLCLPNRWVSSNTMKLFTDASGTGYAAVFGSHWIQGRFPDSWIKVNIAVKELLPIVLAVQLWGHQMKNSRILFMSDNQSVVYVINARTSKDTVMMDLLRKLVIATMSNNIDFQSKHIPGKYNVIADLLSRFQEEKVFHMAPWIRKTKTEVPMDWLPW